MTEYHKPPKQVSNDWTPRLRRGKPQLFARCRWRQWHGLSRDKEIMPSRGRCAPTAPFARPRCPFQRCWQPRTRQTGGACSHSVYGGRPADASQICAFAARPRRGRGRAEREPHTRYTPRPLARETSQNYTPRPLARETSHAKQARTMYSVGESRDPDRRRPRAVPLVLGRLSDREVHGSES